MQVSVKRLAESLDDVAVASQANYRLSDVINRRALPTVEVLQRATASFEDSVNLLSECTRELSTVLDVLAKANAIQSTSQAVDPDN
jgi:hypothetical protein